MTLNWGRNFNMLPCGWYPMLYSPQVTLLTLVATCVSSKRLDLGVKKKWEKSSESFSNFYLPVIRPGLIFNINIIPQLKLKNPGGRGTMCKSSTLAWRIAAEEKKFLMETGGIPVRGTTLCWAMPVINLSLSIIVLGRPQRRPFLLRGQQLLPIVSRIPNPAPKESEKLFFPYTGLMSNQSIIQSDWLRSKVQGNQWIKNNLNDRPQLSLQKALLILSLFFGSALADEYPQKDSFFPLPLNYLTHCPISSCVKHLCAASPRN